MTALRLHPVDWQAGDIVIRGVHRGVERRRLITGTPHRIGQYLLVPLPGGAEWQVRVDAGPHMVLRT